MPAHTTLPPFLVARSASGNERADGCEDHGGAELHGRRDVGAARPHRAQLAGEGLPLGVAGASERVYVTTLGHRDLGDDVRGGAEAVEPERGARRRPDGARVSR